MKRKKVFSYIERDLDLLLELDRDNERSEDEDEDEEDSETYFFLFNLEYFFLSMKINKSFFDSKNTIIISKMIFSFERNKELL